MARLNELPAPAESIEALKRRFIRQNREIARVNSIQSLRIQNLEAEVSHLLGENASLREEIIALTHNLGISGSANVFTAEIDNLKDKLSNKVAELSTLVDALGDLPDKGRIISERTRPVVEVNKENLLSAQPRRLVSRPEWVDDSTKLPIILEHKQLGEATAWSPDFAGEEVVASTPPIPIPTLAPDGDPHNEVLDELQIFKDRKRPQEEQISAEDKVSIPEQSPTRDTTPVDMSLAHETTPSPQPQTDSKARPPFKSGSKRKFGHADEDPLPRASIVEDDFEFRRLVRTPKRANINARTTNPQATEVPSLDNKGRNSKDSKRISRKILQPMSTNISAVTPRKRMATENGQYKETAEPVRQNTKPTKNLQTPNSSQSNSSGTETMMETKASPQKLTPNRGQADATQQSSIQIDGFNSGSSTQHNGEEIPVHSVTSTTSRPTRRPRVNISYAEPNLRDKMRRPTKELVDAVGADRFRRSSTSDVERQDSLDEKCGSKCQLGQLTGLGPSTNERRSALSSIKANDPSLQSGPTYLPDTMNISSLPTTIITERKRRTLSAGVDNVQRTQPVKNIVAVTNSSVSEPQSVFEVREAQSKGSEINPSLLQPASSLDGLVTDNIRHSRRHSSQSDNTSRIVFAENCPKQGRKAANQMARQATDGCPKIAPSPANDDSYKKEERITTRRRSMMV